MLKNIKALREEFGISQQKLADAIGVSQPSINKYENHNIEPDIATLTKMSEYFETSVDYIINNTNIRRKIEQVSEYDLNEKEAALINDFRRLPNSSRKVIEDLIADMLNARRG